MSLTISIARISGVSGKDILIKFLTVLYVTEIGAEPATKF